jgi:molybdopterin-containing oxidoreductase family molybdopterin binding subunit
MANEARLLQYDAEPFLEMSPVDARSRAIDNNDVVRVFNDRGYAKLKARVSERIKPGVVAISEGWWPEQFVEGHLNQLTHEMINPAQNATLGPNAALCDVLVDVRRETVDTAG